MIKNYIFLSLLLFFGLMTQAQDLSLTSTADSYVSKSKSATNYGSEERLLVKGSTNGNFDRKFFLKFDMSGNTTDYNQILVRVIKFDGEEVKVKTQSTHTDWEEGTLTWDNAPAPIKEVGQGSLRTADTVFIDVTNYIKSKISNNQFTVSLELSSTDIIGSPFKVYSRETPTDENRPKLLFYKKEHINVIKGIQLSNYISSDMIIQRGQAFPFRGIGPKGETVEVDFTREGQSVTKTAEVGADGHFEVKIPAMEATGNPCTATIKVKDHPETAIDLDNILIGDVWFAGGQSNMEKRVPHLLQADQVIADADNYPEVRAFRAEYNAVMDPVDEVKPGNASWFVCNSDQVDRISAVAYIYAKKVFKETGVPIGIMAAYVGGSEIETWISEGKIADGPDLKMVKDRIRKLDPNGSKAFQRYPSVNYNGMVNPLRFFPIKGFLFYQGESNVKRAPEYHFLMQALIEDYREKWNLGDLPFYYVELPNIGITDQRNYQKTPDDNTWQELRQQQLDVLQKSGLPNLGMAVTIETNKEHLNPDILIRIHPHNKKPVGERLAKIALKKTYGKSLDAFSPFPEKTWVSGENVLVQWKNVADGLKIREEETSLKGFAVAGQDGIYHEAEAEITAKNVVKVHSSAVSEPKAVAYGWSRDPICTLDNSANLPASPFREQIIIGQAYQGNADAYIQKKRTNWNKFWFFRGVEGQPE